MDKVIEQAFMDWMDLDANPLRTMADHEHPLPLTFEAGYEAGQARATLSQKQEPVEDCPLCKNTGTYCIGTSGLADDGNAPILERCDCEHAFPPPPSVLDLTDDQILAALEPIADDHIFTLYAYLIIKAGRDLIAQARGEA